MQSASLSFSQCSLRIVDVTDESDFGVDDDDDDASVMEHEGQPLMGLDSSRSSIHSCIHDARPISPSLPSVAYLDSETQSVQSAFNDDQDELEFDNNGSPVTTTTTTTHNMSTVSATLDLTVLHTNVIMALAEGRGQAKGEIGLAYIDLNSPILYLAQFVDNFSFESLKIKCQVCSPSEIIFPHTLAENNLMLSTIIECFPNVHFKPFDRRFFSDKKGFEFIQNLAYQNYTWIDIELESKYYALAACSALLQYIQTVKQVSSSLCLAQT